MKFAAQLPGSYSHKGQAIRYLDHYPIHLVQDAADVLAGGGGEGVQGAVRLVDLLHHQLVQHHQAPPPAPHPALPIVKLVPC